MPEYLSPGVYVEEVDTGPKLITGVSTSTTGFVGFTKRGPVDGVPRLVTNFADFRRRYGGYLGSEWGSDRYLAYAIQGFFDNGGQRAYIKRVPGDGALESELELDSGIVHRLADDVADTALSARLESILGIEVGSTVTFKKREGGTVVDTVVTVTAYDASRRRIEWTGAIGEAYGESETWIEVQTTTAPRLPVKARDVGSWGNDLEVRVEYTEPARTVVQPSVTFDVASLETLGFAAAGPNNSTDESVEINAPTNVPDGAIVVVEFTDGTATATRTADVKDTAGTWTLEWTGALTELGGTATGVTLVTVAIEGETTLFLDAADAVALAALSTTPTLRIKGGGSVQVLEVSSIDPGGEITLDPGSALTDSYVDGALVEVTSPAVHGGVTARLKSTRNLYVGALLQFDNGTDREYRTVDAIDGNTVTLASALTHDYEEDHVVSVVEFNLHVRYEDTDERVSQTETFRNLTMNDDVDGKYAPDVVNASSQLIELEDVTGSGSPAVPVPTTTEGTWEALAGGDDGTAPGDDAYIGEDLGPGARTGIQAMVDIDEVSIMAVPGKTSQAIQNALITHCESLLDRFAVIDPDAGLDVQGVQDFRNLYDTQYAALYYPWLTIRDPLTGDDMPLPPSGHMLGIYARTDTERGVHKAPANEVIRNILGLEQIINKGEQDILNPSPTNVNVLRDFRSAGRGLRVWGARVMTSDTSWHYVNVRRLFIYLEESLDQGTQWVVFEPNDHRLWARVKQSVVNFLTRVWRDGALQGRTPEEAFFVRVDETTMTQDDIDNGRLIMIIGVAPSKPAEFVIIRIGQWDGGSSVEEL